MAADTKYGVNKTKLRAVPSQKIDPGDVSGGVMVCYDEFTLTEELEVNDIIDLALKVPAGARIVEALAVCPQLGTTGIFTLGRSGATTSLITSIDAGGQAVIARANGADLGDVMSADTDFYLTATEASDVGVGLKVQVWIMYSYL